MLLSHNAVHSALFLVLNFGAIAVLYLLLHAPFLFAVQITVYAGAIMVLFLFVMMLLGAENGRGRARPAGLAAAGWPGAGPGAAGRGGLVIFRRRSGAGAGYAARRR